MLHKSRFRHHVLQVILQSQHKSLSIHKETASRLLQKMNRILPSLADISFFIPASEIPCVLILFHITPVLVLLIESLTALINVLLRNPHFYLSIIIKSEKYGHFIGFGHGGCLHDMKEFPSRPL